MSKHSILLGTDGPSSTGAPVRFITPSTRVLESPSVNNANNTASSISSTLTPLQQAAFGDYKEDEDDSSKNGISLAVAAGLIPSSSATTRSTAASPSAPWQPSQPIPSTATAVPSDSSTSIDEATIAAIHTMKGMGVSPDMASDMKLLSSAFGLLLKNREKEEESKLVQQTIRAVHAGKSHKDGPSGDPTNAKATCFDLITSTATRIPLTQIMAGKTFDGASNIDTAVEQSSETFVVIQPIDWTIHHANSHFARLTTINKQADEINEIAIEAGQQRNRIEAQLEDLQAELQIKNELIEQQRKQIESLKAQLATSQAQSRVDQSAAPVTAVPANATSTSTSNSTSATTGGSASSFVSNQKVHDSDSSDEDDMVDEEDGDFNRAPASSSTTTASAPSKTFATQ